MKKTLGSIIVTSLLISYAHAENTRDSGKWYVGASLGLINFGGSLEVEDDYRTYKYNEDVDSKPFMLKAGYLQKNDNRLEFYYKKDNIDVRSEIYTASTIGIKSEWGISSLAQNGILPYFTLGLGVGSSSSKYIGYDDGTIIEFDLGLGVHYDINKNFELTTGFFRRGIGNAVSNSYSDYASIASVNGIEFGASYHFQ